jgi:hypothetical protein
MDVKKSTIPVMICGSAAKMSVTACWRLVTMEVSRPSPVEAMVPKDPTSPLTSAVMISERP